MRTNFPWSTVVVIVVTLAAITVMITTGHSSDATVTILIGLIPGLVGTAYAERTSRDIRNGVVQEKAKEGATLALAETGITSETMAQSRDVTNAALNALTELLRSRGADQRGANPNGGSSNGGQGV